MVRSIMESLGSRVMQTGKSILLVESPTTDAPAVKRALDDLGIADCVVCSATAPEALTYLRTRSAQKPCVVLVSVDESGGDGLATLRTIKADDQLRSIPVVVLGPSGNHRMVDESFGLGAAGYMAKSPDYGEVAAALRTLHEYWSLSELPK
jgi:two-component system, chemotaxis family, response regulator Rcp1